MTQLGLFPVEGLKVCVRCQVCLPEDEFYWNVNDRGYRFRRAECKACVRAKQRRWNASDAARDPDRRARNNERSRRWANENVDRVRVVARSWAHANPDKVRAKSRTWQERNRDAQRIAREIRRGAPMDEAAQEWWGVLKHDPCGYCGSRARPSLDHIVPLTAGGTSNWENLTVACLSCNASKNADPLLTFLGRRLRG